MFGFPLVGADICGFRTGTNEEKCARWQAVGAFYPFSRNHAEQDAPDHDPAYMGGKVVTSAKNNLLIRYSLLPYLYTLFYDNTISGKMVFRPVNFEFPLDKNSYEVANDQFMWGSGIMFIPILEENKTSINGYFPPGKWYDWHSKNLTSESSGGERKEIKLDWDQIGIYLRGGVVIPTQDAKTNTVDQMKEKFILMASLDSDQKAEGKLYWDDGDSLDTIKLGSYNLIQFKVENNKFTSSPVNQHDMKDFEMKQLVVLGIKSDVKRVLLKIGGKDQPELKKDDFEWEQGKLTIRYDVTLSKDFEFEWKQ